METTKVWLNQSGSAKLELRDGEQLELLETSWATHPDLRGTDDAALCVVVSNANTGEVLGWWTIPRQQEFIGAHYRCQPMRFSSVAQAKGFMSEQSPGMYDSDLTAWRLRRAKA